MFVDVPTNMAAAVYGKNNKHERNNQHVRKRYFAAQSVAAFES